MSPLLQALVGCWFGGLCIRIACALVADATLDRSERR